MAGNTAGGSTGFEVLVTYDSLCVLSRRFVSNQGLATGMCTVLDAAQRSANASVPQRKATALRTYQQLVETAQLVRALSAEHAGVLSRLADVL